MTAQPRSTDHATGWLANLQVSLFAVTMGLGGLGLAWRAAGRVLGWPAAIGEAVLGLAVLCFIAVALLYGAKFARHRDAVIAEFAHPLKMNFFAAATIGLLLMADAAFPYSRAAAETLWIVGAGLHLTLALSVVRCWVTRNYEIHHSSPAWFIPVVGNIIVPVAGVPLGYVEVSWFFFAVGLVFWIVLFAIVLYRIIFHDQLPAKALPTLFILLAPPALGFSAYDSLAGGGLAGGGLDAFGRVLFYAALFLVLFLLTMVPRFLKVPFALSWWAYTFPSAAMASAALRFHELVSAPATAALSAGLLIGSTAIIALVAAATLGALFAGRLFLPDG